MKKNLSLLGGLIASTLLIGSQAHAAAAEAFTTATTTSLADVATYGAALVGVSAVGVGFMIAMKYVKKISRAA